VRSILAGRDHVALAIDNSRGEGAGGNLADLALTLANLAALGYPVDLARWDDGYEAPEPASSRKGLTIKVCGANPVPGPLAGPDAVGSLSDQCAPPAPSVSPFELNHRPSTNGRASSAAPAALPATLISTTDPPLPSAPQEGQGFLATAIQQSQ